MKLFTALLTLSSSVLFPGVDGNVDDCNSPITVTELDFFNSTLTNNTLHLADGELRFSNIGFFESDPLDLKVTARSDYTDIVDTWIARGKGNATNPNTRGINGAFGTINLQTVYGLPNSGKGNFTFCIVDQGTDNLRTLPNFTFTVWDLDWRSNTTLKSQERMIIDASNPSSGIKSWTVFPTKATSEVKPICRNGATVSGFGANGNTADAENACPGKTVFRSSAKGAGTDNPDDPELLDDLQRSRSVNFFLENTACFNLVYDHFCSKEQPLSQNSILLPPDNARTARGQCSNGGDGTDLKKGDGGNFLFSGKSDALFFEPGCPTSSPSESPSAAPSASPTTSFPSESPSVAPSESPSASPSKEPSTSPSKSPSDVPSESPSKEPSKSPSESPSGSPSKEPSTFPSESPSVAPSASPSKVPTRSPSETPSASPSEEPSQNPTFRIPSIPCPEDVMVYQTIGVTEITSNFTVEIVEQERSKVTVKLWQTWTDISGSIDSIHYRYRKNDFEEPCFSATDVPGITPYAEDIEIQCLRCKPYAELDICVSDSDNLQPEDDAQVPACCPDLPTNPSTTACYKVIVACDTVCPNDPQLAADRRRALRGFLVD